jgi:hypothetical protein
VRDRDRGANLRAVRERPNSLLTKEERPMKNSRVIYVPIGAVAVAFAWSLLVAEPQRSVSPYPLPATEVAPYNWQADAGQVFGLLPTQIESAMTEEEWQTHQKKMVVMKPDQRVRYQQEVRSRILKQVQG